ncbi:hypothetical protein OVA13_10745 [Pseudoxanthomonas sp. SL93]|jgi:hypothetical protein|uniref:hypothetical protein n=1 Tax=Pseudoxanthomonas sp. SL93 TaxID=2995142 RepID=UPI00227066CE|nr:hypothetical protein [Pseudoxanthomonas sp. SL93]WAC61886.1 hypothetical protein OVA13_10745 [Pseudoxanthomonas sp. SL93]
MPLHPVTESDTADSGPTLSTPHALTASPRALDQVLILLQGVAKNSLADPGITLLPPAQLDLLTVHARQQADQCQEGILLMLDLLQDRVGSGCLPDVALMQRLVAQLHDLLHDQQRWHALADNAAYYRDHATVAARIAAYLHALRA